MSQKQSHKPKDSAGILPANGEDRDFSLTPRVALFGLVGGSYEVPPFVPTPLTHIPLDSPAHRVQMVATDVLPRGASW